MRILALFALCLASFLGAKELEWNRDGLYRYAKEAKRRLGWKMTGEGYVRKDDQMIPCIPGIAFESTRQLSVEEARRYVVPEVLKLIALMNQGQKKSVIEAVGPFAVRNLSLSVSFSDPVSKTHYSPPAVAGVFLCNGRVCYSSYGYIDEKVKGWNDLHIESFEEAVRIVQGEKRAGP